MSSPEAGLVGIAFRLVVIATVVAWVAWTRPHPTQEVGNAAERAD
jgi:hypothetical protein